MGDSCQFAADVFRTVCDRLAARAADLRLLVETTSSFEEWLNWEAFLACKLRQASYPFCEVTAKPTYGSEGVMTDTGDPDRNFGDLRVVGPGDGADHRWVFAEFALSTTATGQAGSGCGRSRPTRTSSGGSGGRGPRPCWSWSRRAGGGTC